MWLLSSGALEQNGETDTCTNSDGAWWTAVTTNVTSSLGKGLGSPQDTPMVPPGKAPWRREYVS